VFALGSEFAQLSFWNAGFQHAKEGTRPDEGAAQAAHDQARNRAADDPERGHEQAVDLGAPRRMDVFERPRLMSWTKPRSPGEHAQRLGASCARSATEEIG
jgi:hypothetical protein